MPVSRGAEGQRGSGSGELRFDTSIWTRIAKTLHNLAGMPDYDAYIEHLRRFHPERPMLTERQFYDAFVELRYGDGPTRCC